MKLSAMLAALVGGQLVFSFAIQALIMVTLGAGTATDCFVAAQTIPTMLLSILSTALLGVFQARMAIADEKESRELMASSMGQGLIIAGVLLLLLVVLGDPLIILLFPGFDAPQARLTADLMRIASVGTAFNVCTVPSVAVGRVKSRFLVVEAIPLGATLIALAATPWALERYGVFGAAWLMAGRALLIFLSTSATVGMIFPAFGYDASMRQTLRQLRPVLLGSSIYKMGPVVDRFWGSHTPAGQLTIYNFASIAASASASVIERALVSPLIPETARCWQTADQPAFLRLLHGALLRVWSVTVLCMLAMIPAWFVWNPLSALLLKFDAAQAQLFFYLVLTFLPQLGTTASGTLLVSIFYAADRVESSVRIITIVFVVGLIAKSAAFSFFGLVGMAIANTLQLIGISGALYLGVRKLIKRRTRG
jgi:peptidoglycan biosynthesis protein MviN/MurJ (putative lipid II flippase)